MTVEYFKVTDPILAEERTSDGPVEPRQKFNIRDAYQVVFLLTSIALLRKVKIRNAWERKIGDGPSELKTPVPNKDCKVLRNTSPFSYSSKCVESIIC